MINVLLFAAAIGSIVLYVGVMALYFRHPFRKWIAGFLILVTLLLVLPPSPMSDAILVALVLFSFYSNRKVLRRYQSARLHVGHALQPASDSEKGEKVSPFPVMEGSQANPELEAYTANPTGNESDELNPSFARESHPRKKGGSKRKKRSRQRSRPVSQATSNSDIPPADKPTIEEYLSVRGNFDPDL